MSHTVTVDVKLKNVEVAISAAEAMGATIIGHGTHRLFSSQETGTAIQFSGWKFPLVIKADGSVAFDNYNGVWGDAKKLDQLKEYYATEMVKAECDALGWYHEQNKETGEIVIHHPDGGQMIVSPNGKVDAVNFTGTSCEDATSRIEAAMGTVTDRAVKPELQIGEVQINNQGE